MEEKNFQQRLIDVAKSSGGWVDLIAENDTLTMYGTGFSEMIRPLSKLTKLCCEWRSLPPNKDYLATQVVMIAQMYVEAGYRSSHEHLSINNLQWHMGDKLFQQCPAKALQVCKCNRLQRIYQHKWYKTLGKVRTPGNLKEYGCVIFGKSLSSLIRPA